MRGTALRAARQVLGTLGVTGRPAAGRPDAGPLARCVGDPDAFAAQHWGRAPLLTRNGAGFRDLLDLDGVDELLSRRGLRTPFIRMAKAGQVLDSSAFTAPGRGGRRDRRPGPRRQGGGPVRRRRHRRPAGPAPQLAAGDRVLHPARGRARPPGAGQRLRDAAGVARVLRALRRARRLRAPARGAQALDDPRPGAHRPPARPAVGPAVRGRRRGGAGAAGDRHGARAGRRAVPAAGMAARGDGAR